MNTTTARSTGHYRRRARRSGLAIAAGFILAASTLLTAGTVLADSVVVTTEVQDENGSTSSPFDLGSIVHDIVTILTSGGADIPDGSNVSFEFYTDDTCTTLSPPVEGVSVGPASSPVSVSSSPLGPLHAGDYSYKVWFNSGLSSAVSDGVSPCEPFSVAMAATTTSTAVKGLSAPTSGPQWVHNPAFDTATVDTDGYDGFDLDSDVTFTLWDNSTCDGTVVGSPEDVGISGAPPQTVQSSDTVLDPGFYSYRATYNGNPDYESSTSECEPFTVVPAVEVLRGTCTFDLNPDVAGDQFNLIYTPFISNWKLNASNPGQMFVDIFFINGVDGMEGDAYLNMPFPFVTQGAMPVHFYDGVTITEPEPDKFCYEPGDGLGASAEMVALGDYDSDPEFGEFVEMEIEDVPAATTGLTLIRIHVDYGLKMEAFECTHDGTPKDPPTDAECDVPFFGLTDFVIPDFQEYVFSVTVGDFSSDTIESQNQFKRVNGVAGLVLSASGDPYAGVRVEIWQGTKLWKVVSTDEDGWYMAQFKYTGKPTTFTVKIIDLGIQKAVGLKSNGFAVVSFYGDYSEFTFIDLTTTDTSTDSGGSTGGDSGGGGDTGGGGKGKGGGGGGGKKP